MITKLFLKIIEPSSLPRDQQSTVVDKPIFRIGRDQDNDWVIPSPDRLISRNHCVIEHINNTFTITDLSKNGVIINNSPSPIGLGNSGALNDGDILILPGIRISVTFAEDKASPAKDPFLALLPTRENGVQAKDQPQETINSSSINLNQIKSESYDFLKDRSSLPILDNSADITTSDKNWQSRSKPNFDRLPAERDSFRAALPNTLAIPEDWYKEDNITPQAQISTKAEKDLSTAQRNYNSLPKPADLQKNLLLELISKFSEIERSISISRKSDLASILNERSLNWLGKKDYDIAVELITEVTQRCVRQTEIRKIPTSVSSEDVTRPNTEDIIDQILQKNSEDVEVRTTTDFPSTGGNIDELE